MATVPASPGVRPGPTDALGTVTGPPIPLPAREFKEFQQLIYDLAGIHLAEAKRALVVSRLGRRLRALGLESFRSYLDLVADPGHADEVVEMLDAITTNETSFFREQKQFEHLERVVLPQWLQQGQRGKRSRHVRVWSAACATGEEPYSLAMFLRYHLPEAQGWTVEVLATDLSTRALQVARHGIWAAERIRSVPAALRKRYLLQGVRSQDGRVAMGPEIRALVNFKRLNLMEPRYAVSGLFDLVFVRNVFIYFDADSRHRALTNLLRFLAPEGYLCLGHAESANQAQYQLTSVSPTIYAWASNPWPKAQDRSRRLVQPPLFGYPLEEHSR